MLHSSSAFLLQFHPLLRGITMMSGAWSRRGNQKICEIIFMCVLCVRDPRDFSYWNINFIHSMFRKYFMISIPFEIIKYLVRSGVRTFGRLDSSLEFAIHFDASKLHCSDTWESADNFRSAEISSLSCRNVDVDVSTRRGSRKGVKRENPETWDIQPTWKLVFITSLSTLYSTFNNIIITIVNPFFCCFPLSFSVITFVSN